MLMTDEEYKKRREAYLLECDKIKTRLAEKVGGRRKINKSRTRGKYWKEREKFLIRRGKFMVILSVMGVPLTRAIDMKRKDIVPLLTEYGLYDAYENVEDYNTLFNLMDRFCDMRLMPNEGYFIHTDHRNRISHDVKLSLSSVATMVKSWFDHMEVECPEATWTAIQSANLPAKFSEELTAKEAVETIAYVLASGETRPDDYDYVTAVRSLIPVLFREDDELWEE